jgi:hypothetical protein
METHCIASLCFVTFFTALLCLSIWDGIGDDHIHIMEENVHSVLNNVSIRDAYVNATSYIAGSIVKSKTDPHVDDHMWIPRVEPNILHNSGPCPFDDLDIIIPLVGRRDLLLLDALLKSIQNFMPCYREMHIFVPDMDDYKAVLGALPMSLPNVQVHIQRIPPGLSFGVQSAKLVWTQYGNFLIDEYSSATYFMFMDSDSILHFPVTCQSLFDYKGRPIWLPFPWDPYDKKVIIAINEAMYYGMSDVTQT